MKINVSKCHGTENHFLIFHSNEKKVHSKKTILSIIDQNQSERVDGVLILSDESNVDFKMDYYNNDGSWETMCANGARCAVLYMQNQIKQNKEMIFKAGDGIHQAVIINENYVSLQMNTPKYCSKIISLLGIQGRHVDSGATHFVIEYPDITDQDVRKLGAQIRYDKIFSPRGINVNFYTLIDHHNIHVKTYEKGIEDLMMSCGSGAVACAFHLSQIQKIESPVNMKVPGGQLKVTFTNNWEEVWLSGSATIEYSFSAEV